MATKRLFVLFVIFIIIVNVFGAIVYRQERSISTNHRTNREAESSENICQNRTPCGWAIYKRFTRQVDFFMRNNCECPKEKKCLRTDDDISVSAYIYRCVDDVA